MKTKGLRIRRVPKSLEEYETKGDRLEKGGGARQGRDNPKKLGKLVAAGEVGRADWWLIFKRQAITEKLACQV